MNDLAIAYVTCDKYSYVWNEWYPAYLMNWHTKLPIYFLGEENECPFDGFINIPHPSVTAEHWTSKLRAQIEQIPQNNIFIWLDDHVQQFSIDMEFHELYWWFIQYKVDALRIMGRKSRAHYIETAKICGRPLYVLKKGSPYMISFSPNIYRKDFLLEILDRDESPWDIEILGSKRVSTKRFVCAYHINGWYINTVVQ